MFFLVGIGYDIVLDWSVFCICKYCEVEYSESEKLELGGIGYFNFIN